MNPTFQLDEKIFAEFQERIRDLHATTGRDLLEIVEQQGRLVVYDCIKSTPPNSKSPIQESFAVQKKAGERAIENDVDRLYEPLSNIQALTSPRNKRLLKKQFQDWAARGNWKQISEVLFALKITDKRRPVVEQADANMQRQRRGGNGRISSKFKDPILVQDGSSIRLIKTKLKERAGYAKAGWMKAAKALGVKGIPDWVSRHASSPGDFKNTTQDKSAPSIEFANWVSYIERLNSNAGILNRALKNRNRAMEISAEKAIEHFVQKFNRS